MTDTIATPNPGPAALTGASGVSILLGWAAGLVAHKLTMPIEVAGAILGGAFTLGTSIWHRFFGPAIPVTTTSVPTAPKQP